MIYGASNEGEIEELQSDYIQGTAGTCKHIGRPEQTKKRSKPMRGGKIKQTNQNIHIKNYDGILPLTSMNAQKKMMPHFCYLKTFLYTLQLEQKSLNYRKKE